MALAPRTTPWEAIKPRLARWIPLFGYLTAQRIGNSCCHLQRGKIQPPYSFEIDAVDHCNLACIDCDHAAPLLREMFADPAVVYTDLHRLSRHYRARVARVTGGEALLHPDIVELLHAIHRSGISRRLHLVTNGQLLEQMSDRAWGQLDIIEVSIYPQAMPSAAQMKTIRDKAAQFRTEVQFWQYATFSCTFALQGTNNRNLVARIYRNCLQANVRGCHSIYQGYFYKCPQALYLAKIVPDGVLAPGRDGLRITDSPAFQQALIDYITSAMPLDACRFCLGNVGRVREHRQASAEEYRTRHDHPTEELIDFDQLTRIEADPTAIKLFRKPYLPQTGNANR